jgi:hypothetical protein
MSKQTQSNPNEKAILAALEDSRYQWRTVNGVIRNTKLTRDEVLHGLNKLIDADVAATSQLCLLSRKSLPSIETRSLPAL